MKTMPHVLSFFAALIRTELNKLTKMFKINDKDTL